MKYFNVKVKVTVPKPKTLAYIVKAECIEEIPGIIASNFTEVPYTLLSAVESAYIEFFNEESSTSSNFWKIVLVYEEIDGKDIVEHYICKAMEVQEVIKIIKESCSCTEINFESITKLNIVDVI